MLNGEVSAVQRGLSIQSATTSYGSTIGAWNAPLSYVKRRDISVPDPLPPSMDGKPWSEACGSIQNEMDLCFTHDDLIFGDDNHAIQVS
jgi:hypothetical protein